MLTFKNLVYNKNIAVVGNASSLFDLNYGEEIDSHDLVIRMNKPAIFYDDGNYISHGSKLDIWAFWSVGAFYKRCIVKEDLPQLLNERFHGDRSIKKIQMYLNGHTAITKKYIDETLHPKSFSELERKLKSLSHSKRNIIKPSVGIALLEWLSICDSFNTITVYGFDWKKTPTFSEQISHEKDIDEDRYDARCKHDFKAEETYFFDVLKTDNIILKQ